MRLHPSPAHRSRLDAGSALSGVLVAVLILAVVAVGAFYYFGGRADVKIKKPNVSVTSTATPS